LPQPATNTGSRITEAKIARHQTPDAAFVLFRALLMR